MDIRSYTTCTGLCLNWSLTTSHYQVSLNQITQPAPFPNCCRAGRAAIIQTPDGRRDTEASSSLTSKTGQKSRSMPKDLCQNLLAPLSVSPCEIETCRKLNTEQKALPPSYHWIIPTFYATDTILCYEEQITVIIHSHFPRSAAYRGSIGKSDKGILMAIPCTISQVSLLPQFYGIFVNIY